MIFWKKSLLAKLVGSFLVLYLAILLIVNYVIFARIETEFKTTIFKKLDYIAVVKERELNSWIVERIRDIKSLSNLSDLSSQAKILLTENPTETESKNAFEKLTNFLNNWDTLGLKDIYILDRRDRILFSTNLDRIGDYMSSENYREANPNIPSNIDLNFYTLRRNENPQLSFAAPFKNDNQERIGTLVADLDLQAINQIVKEENELGKTITSYLILDRPQNIMSGKILSWQKFIDRIDSQKIKQSINTQKIQDIYLKDRGIRSFGVYRRMKNYPAGFLVEMEEKAAYSSFNQIARSTLQIDLFVALLFVIAMFLIVSKIVKPIKAITRSATQVASGNFQSSAPVLTQDEIGVLARAFNQMTEQLRSLYAALEKKVAERTAKLSQTNEQLKLEINQRKQTEKQLNQAKEAAEVASRTKSQFLARMSHELRTPLNAILGFSELLRAEIKNRESLNNKQQEYLEIINRSGKTLLESIEVILEMSKIEAGEVSVNNNEFELYRLLDNLEERFKKAAELKQLKLNFERADNLPQYIKADETKLNQVLINLIDNGIKFTKKGSVTVTIKYIEPNLLQFYIEDTGIGIEGAEINNLFEPFAQTKIRQHSDRGMGLGLAIAQKFVELMAGEITVESQENIGSIFIFSVKIEAVKSDINIENESNLVAIALAENQKKSLILVVEDNWENRELLTYLLTTIGFETVAASNGEEAIYVWQEKEPDLILMDIEMPIMNGFEATEKIKASCQGNSPKIIALTGNTSIEAKAKISAAGCDDYLSKPFQDKILLAKIASQLGVKYIYENWQEATTDTQENSQPELTVSDLEIMSPEWISQLYYLAAAADSVRIFELLEKIPHSNRYLAESIADLVDNFSFEEIVDLAELAMKNTN